MAIGGLIGDRLLAAASPWLTLVWLIVLFAGGVIVGKNKSVFGKGMLAGTLITIPATAILIWLIN